MGVYIPRNVLRLAKLTQPDNPRYAVQCIRVLDPGDTTYRLEATNGRVLGIIRGNSVKASYAVTEDAANGLQEALIHASDWTQGFRLGGKKDVVGLTLGDPCIFGSETGSVQFQPADGRFPPVDDVLPKSPPLLTIRVTPKILAQVLEVVCALEIENLALHYYAKDKPVGLCGKNEQGQFFDGMLMPLT